MKDMQRSKLYRAEQEAFAGHPPACIQFCSVKQVQEYVDRLTASTWWTTYDVKGTGQHDQNRLRVCFPISRAGHITIKDGRGRRSGCASGTTIKLPKFARKKWYILHEVAHIIAFEEPGHGWQFASIYLDLVGRFIGTEAKDRLKVAFKKHKVRWKPKANRKGNPEALRKWRLEQNAAESVASMLSL